MKVSMILWNNILAQKFKEQVKEIFNKLKKHFKSKKHNFNSNYRNLHWILITIIKIIINQIQIMKSMSSVNKFQKKKKR